MTTTFWITECLSVYQCKTINKRCELYVSRATNKTKWCTYHSRISLGDWMDKSSILHKRKCALLSIHELFPNLLSLYLKIWTDIFLILQTNCKSVDGFRWMISRIYRISNGNQWITLSHITIFFQTNIIYHADVQLYNEVVMWIVNYYLSYLLYTQKDVLSYKWLYWILSPVKLISLDNFDKFIW